MHTRGLLDRHDALWQAAVRHPFLDAVRDGTLPPAALATWLVQDFRFVSDLLDFQRALAARAPDADREVLAGGVTALEDELRWFGELAAERGLDLDADPLPATVAYSDLLARLDALPYPVAVTALWVLERVYLEAWRGASPCAPEHAALVEHWTTPAFASYVEALQALADRALDGEPGEAEPVVAEVLEQERAFWDMALA